MKMVQIGDATLYLGDCREILPTLPKVDAVVTDPPYGINHKVERTDCNERHDKRSSERIIGDREPFDPAPWIGGPAILWGANYYADKLPPSGGWLVWDKRRNGTHAPGFAASDCELAWSNVRGSAKTLSHLWAGICRDSEVGEHWHPTQKPVALMDWCIQLLPVANILLDPFMGSGTTGVACANLGRKFIGVEIDPRYFDIACERISSGYAQRRLFA